MPLANGARLGAASELLDRPAAVLLRPHLHSDEAPRVQVGSDLDLRSRIIFLVPLLLVRLKLAVDQHYSKVERIKRAA